MANDPNSKTEAKSSPPPYISFRTLLNLVERMADEGIPRRIDRSYLGGLSGAYQTQVMAALRSLGLMTDDGAVTPRSTTEELRTRYVEMLMKRVEAQDDVDDKLLDRIEALLGYEGSQARDEVEGQE